MQAGVRRNVRLLSWFNFLLEFRLYAPIMIIYFERVTGSYLQAMSVFSAVWLASAVLELPTGMFSDLIGRRRTIIVGAVASLAAVICYAIGDAYWILLLGALFEGVERALFSGNNDALLHDTLAELDDRGAYQVYLGRVSSALQVALAISAVVGGVLAAVSFAIVMWLSVLPKLAMVVISFWFVEPRLHTDRASHMLDHLKEAVHQFRINPRLRMLNIGRILIIGIGESGFQFRTVFIEMLWPLWAIGVARTLSNLTAAVSFYFAGDWLKRFGERRLLFGGVLSSKMMNLTALLLSSGLSPVLMGMTSIFYGVNSVSMNGLMQREFTDAQRSTMGSLTAFGGSICVAFMSLGLGWLADVIGVRNALIIMTLLNILPLYFYRQAFKRESVQPAGWSNESMHAVKRID